MAKNLDLSGIDFSESNQPEAKATDAPGLDLNDIDFGDEAVSAPAPEQEDSWGQVVYKSLSAMPERMQRSWQGLKQAIAPAFNNTDVDAQAESLIAAAQSGVESANAKLAELGFNPNDMGFINKGKLRQALAFDNIKDDEDFKAARDEGIRLSAEIAKTAPKTGEQWSPKNLVSTILTGAQDMAPAVLLGLITKNPGAGLAEMTGQAYGSYMQDSLDKGLTPAEANNRATLFAALEPLTESIPMGFLLKPAGKGLTDLGKTAIAEGLQESFTQAAQDAYDIGALGEDMTVGDFLNNMAFSGVTGAGVGATLHGGIHGPGMVKEALDQRAVGKAAGAAAAESGQAVEGIDPAEYDAVRAEMGGDALDNLTEQVVPEISAARRQAYADARAAGLSPADALQQARGQDTGADLLDQMVADVFDSPDSIYYANKQSAVNPPQSVAEMVSQQAAQGDMGPVTGEMLGLPSPGQTSTIAMPGPIAPISEPAGFRVMDTRDETRAPAPGFRPQLQIDDIVNDIEQTTPELLALPRPDQTSTIAMPGPLHQMPEMTEPSRPKFSPTAQQDERATSIGKRPNELGPLPPKKPELGPLPPPIQAEPSMARKLWGRTKKTVAEPEVDQEALAAEEARQAEMKQKGDEAVARMERRADLGTLPGKKPAPLKVTRELVAAAKERGVEPGNKVNWNGKQYDVDKLQGRAVRLIDENGNGHIADIREVNAPEQQQTQAPKQALDVSDIDLTTPENQARTRYGLEPVAEDTDPRSLQQRLNDAQVETERSIGMAKDVQRGLDEMISEKEKDANAIEGEATRVPEIPEEGKRLGFEPITEGHELYGKFAKDNQGVNRPIVAMKGRQYMLDNGDKKIQRFGKDDNISDSRVPEFDRQVHENTINDLIRQAENTKRPLSKMRDDMAAMVEQTDRPDLYGPVTGKTRAAIRKELEARKASIEAPAKPKLSPENQAKSEQMREAKKERMETFEQSLTDYTRTLNPLQKRNALKALEKIRPNGVSTKSYIDTALEKNLPIDEDSLTQSAKYYLAYKRNRMPKKPTAPVVEREPAKVGDKFEDDGVTYTITGEHGNFLSAEDPDGRRDSFGKEYAARKVEAFKKKPSGAASIKESKPESKGMKPEEVAEIARDFIKQFKGVNAVDMSVMGRQEDLGIDIPEGSSLLGFYEPGKISAKLISENLNSREEVEELLRHELIVHFGMRARLSKQEYDAEMDKVLAAEKSLALRKYFAEARAKYDDFYDTSSPDGQRMIAEEVVARVAEDPKALEKSSVIRRVLEALRQLLIKAKILPNNASMESVKKLIQANAEYLKNTTVDRNDVRVSLPPMAYNAPQDMTAAMNKPTDIDQAEVPDDIKDAMRRTMYRDNRSMFQRITDMLKDRVSPSGIYQGVFDDLNAIARYEKMSNNGKLKMGRESAYKFSMLAKNINSVVAVAMNKGAPVYDNGTIGVNKNTKGFTEIFKPVMEMKGNMLPVWEYWAGAVRAKRLLAEGREQLYTQKEVDDIIDYVNRRPELRKAFNQAHKDWRDLNKAVLDFGEATGIVDPEARKLFESDDYVPFYRVDEEADKVSGPTGKRGLANQSSGIRRLKGGEGKLDILENMARNVDHIISSGFKNAAMQRVKDIALGAAIEEVPTNFKPVGISNDAIKKALNDMGVATSGMSAQQLKGYTNLFTAVAPAGPNIITVRYNGKPQYFEVTDPQLMRAIAGIGPERLHAILKVLAIPKKILTRMTTSTPTFIAQNMVRDVSGNFVQAANAAGRNTPSKVIQDILTLRPFYRAFRGFGKSFMKDGMVTDYQVSGGMSGGYDQSRPESVAKHLRSLNKRNVVIDTPKKLWEMYEQALTASEQATRMAVYEDVLKNTGDPVEAAYQANDVMNFSRRGDNVLTHVLISTVPFLNARLQGLDRLARGAKESPKAFLLKGAIITAATMALMAMNADDEDYWALPEYERDLYWIIPMNGIRYRIPKPFEIGAVFGTMPERIFEATFRQDHMLWERTKFMLTSTFALDLPQFIKPIYEDSANINSFTQRPIVPQALQRVGPNEQYATTTPDWIKGMAKSMPEWAPDWMRSPLRLQHMLEAYTGSIGSYVVAQADAAYRSALTDRVMPAAREYDYPVVRAFVRGGESNNKYVDRLYQMQEKAGEFYGTAKAYKDQKMREEYRQFTTENKSVLAARRSIDKSVAAMQKLNKQTKAIYANDNMTPEAKREALDKLTVKKNELAKEVSDKYWMLF